MLHIDKEPFIIANKVESIIILIKWREENADCKWS